MYRPIRSAHSTLPAAPEPIPRPPTVCRLSLDTRLNRCALQACVTSGQTVRMGQVLARCAALAVHAPRSGTITELTPTDLQLACAPNDESGVFPPVPRPTRDDLPAFAADMGLAGMGGSLFPAALKLSAATAVQTLVINAVECEPGIEIDLSLLIHQSDRVSAGVQVLADALGIHRIVLALKRSTQPLLKTHGPPHHYEALVLPDQYPAGAEKLILRALLGRLPPTGVRPVQLGILVFSVASLWAIGRRILEGRPSIDRPLTWLRENQPPRNLLVPIGTPVRQVLAACGADPEDHPLRIAGGLMMGQTVTLDDPIGKGTNALWVRTPEPRLLRPEEPCILCGACHDACPLALHPSGMAERIRAGAATPALQAQLDECFLCGACSAVCPADIPLAALFRKARTPPDLPPR